MYLSLPSSCENRFFFLNCFWWTRGPFFVFILLYRPSEDSLQRSTISDGSPSEDWQSTVGWGDCQIWTGTAGLQSGVATNETARNLSPAPGVTMYRGRPADWGSLNGLIYNTVLSLSPGLSVSLYRGWQTDMVTTEQTNLVTLSLIWALLHE